MYSQQLIPFLLQTVVTRTFFSNLRALCLYCLVFYFLNSNNNNFLEFVVTTNFDGNLTKVGDCIDLVFKCGLAFASKY